MRVGDIVQLYCKVERHGFGYYMINYGPDLDLLQEMGFDKKKVKKAIALFKEIQEEIEKIPFCESEK